MPDDNPCGIYEREFTVIHPERKTYIVFEGIASLDVVYINGAYFGMGPGETYCDLHHYADYGLWQSNAQQEYVPYIKPQEHGNHYGVGFLSFANGLCFKMKR